MVSAKIASYAAAAASTVAAADSHSAVLDGVQGSVTNTKQVIQTLTKQLQSNDGHPASDVITAVITGLDSQIDNGIATISQALAPFTFGASEAVGDALLGPFAQSVTNGAEVVLSNLIGAPADFISDAVRNSFANTLSNVAKTGSQYNVNTERLTQLSEQIRAVGSRNHVKRQNTIVNGVHSGVVNAQQTMDTLVKQLQSNDGHPTADVITAVITGLDSQIDNGIATISEALSPLTFGVSQQVGDFLLGPFIQSVTNGAEVVLSNVLGGPADFISEGVRNAFANTLGTAAKVGSQYNVNTERLAEISNKLKVAPSSTHHKRQTAVMDGVQGSVTNTRQVIQTLTKQLQSNDGHPASDVITAVITGLDSQIDNGIATISQALAPFTFGASEAVGGALLGPFAQSVTNGAEVVLSNLIGAPADFISDAVRNSFANTLSNVAKTGSQYNVNTQRLSEISNQLRTASTSNKASTHHKRQTAVMDGVQGSVTNTRQVVQTLTKQLQSNDGHPTADVITAVITGLDSQIDNGIATISQALAPLTFGLSEAVGGALLGPFAQSVTNGAEVVLSNLLGAPADFVTDAIRNSFATTLNTVAKTGSQYNVNTQRLSEISNQLRTASSSTKGTTHHKRQTAVMDGVQGSVTNTRQVIQTLTKQLQSNDGHPASDVITAVITGLDSQIDNGIATISQALAPFTFGASEAVGGALLGPFAQSVTNGAEVVLSNLLGAPADFISDAVRNSFANTLSNVAKTGSQYNVNTQRLSEISNQLRTASIKSSHH